MNRASHFTGLVMIISSLQITGVSMSIKCTGRALLLLLLMMMASQSVTGTECPFCEAPTIHIHNLTRPARLEFGDTPNSANGPKTQARTVHEIMCKQAHLLGSCNMPALLPPCREAKHTA
jgi:hypothetical protein